MERSIVCICERKELFTLSSITQRNRKGGGSALSSCHCEQTRHVCVGGKTVDPETAYPQGYTKRPAGAGDRTLAFLL